MTAPRLFRAGFVAVSRFRRIGRRVSIRACEHQRWLASVVQSEAGSIVVIAAVYGMSPCPHEHQRCDRRRLSFRDLFVLLEMLPAVCSSV